MQSKNLFSILFLFSLFTATINLFAQKQHSFYPSFQDRQLSPGKTSYYIDPRLGNDNNSGIDKKKPWKSFKRINQLILSPGDVLEVLSAGAFHETLALMARGKQTLPVKVKFAPGRYDLFPDNTLKIPLHISNTNDSPYVLKAIALMLDSCEFTILKGQNTNFVLRGKMIETYVNNSNNIHMDGLSFDYQRPTVSELKVTSVGSNYADLQIHKDSKFSIKDSLLTWQGEGWSDLVGSYWQALDLQTNEIARVQIPIQQVSFVSMGENNVRAFFKQKHYFKKDLIYQTRSTERDYAAIFMQRSKNIELKNIRINFMHGMGVVSQYCENIKVDNIVVKPADSSGRTCAAWADILHFSGCKGMIDIGNSYLSAANDDAINIHGTHLKIIKIEKPNKIRVKFMHDETYGFDAFSVGDSLDLIRTESLLPIGSNIVLHTERLNDRETVLTLKDPLPYNLRINDVVENTTATPQVRIHHNTIARIPTRGILVTTRRKTVIEYNDFQHTRMSGILVNDDASSWYESGMVRNLMIRNNNFIECDAPAITIFPENTEKNDVSVHNNIAIINNTFYLRGSKVLLAKSTSNILIDGNTVKMQNATKKIEELVDLVNCKQVKISNNKIMPK